MARKQDRLLNDLASGAILAAKNQDCVSAFMDDLSLISDILATPGVLNALTNAAVPLEKRIEALMNVAEDKFEPLTLKAMALLMEKRLLGSFDDFCRKTETAARETANYHVCRTVSAAPMNDKDKQKLKEIMEKKFSGKVSIRYAVDPSVIGGLAVTCGDWRYLGTIQAKLQQLSRHLITA
jgi:F-type H+-transporting ATPase subunit delta